jgi:hypothetical protein
MNRATTEAKGLGFADGHDIRSAFEVVYATPLFAGKVGTKSDKWRIVEGRSAVWRWAQHNHVRVGGGNVKENCNGDSAEREFSGGHSIRD